MTNYQMSIFWLVKKNWVERKKIHGKIHLLGHFLFLLSAAGWERFHTVCAPYPSLPCTSSRIPKYAVHSTAVKTQNWANITILTPGEWQPKICAVKSGWGLSAGKCLLFAVFLAERILLPSSAYDQLFWVLYSWPPSK